MIVKYVVLTKSNEFQNICFKVSKTNKVKNKYHDQVGSVLLTERKKGLFKKNFVFLCFTLNCGCCECFLFCKTV